VDFETYEKSGRTAYAALAEAVADILSAAISQRKDVRLQHIQRRAKDRSSLKSSVSRTTTSALFQFSNGRWSIGDTGLGALWSQ